MSAVRPFPPTPLQQLEILTLPRERVHLILTPGLHHLYAQLADAETNVVYVTVSAPPKRCYVAVDKRGVIDFVVGDDYTGFSVSREEADRITAHFGDLLGKTI